MIFAKFAILVTTLFLSSACRGTTVAADTNAYYSGLVQEIHGYILSADTEGLIRILTGGHEVQTVAAGFRFEPEDKEIFTKVSSNRDNDPDVVSIRAFAEALLHHGASPQILADIWRGTIFQEDTYYVDDWSALYTGMFESFSSPSELQAVLDTRPTTPWGTTSVSIKFRRLLATPPSTTMCYYCFEHGICSKNVPWCKNVPPPPVADISTASGEVLVGLMQDAILSGDRASLVSALNTNNDMDTLPDGFRYKDEDKVLFTQMTPERNGDPDVVAIRSFADAIVNHGGSPQKLAEVLFQAFYREIPECYPEPSDTYHEIFNVFNNMDEMRAILTMQPEYSPHMSTLEFPFARRLAAVKATSANVTPCSSCFKCSACKAASPFCKTCK